MKYEVCSNCGADEGLHHYETQQCPKNGIEEYREGRKQEWQDTTFYPADKKRLEDAAPELLSVLKEAKEVLLQLDHRHNGKCYNPTENECNCTLCKIDKVLNKAQ